MDAELLRRGCEAAGLLWDGNDKEWCGDAIDSHSGAFLYAHDDPALPAYVASLLVSKAFCEWTVTEMDTSRVPYRWECEGHSDQLEKHSGTGSAPEDAIIRAALAVLEGEANE